MYKLRTTARDLRAHAWAIVSIGYCDIQNIERYLEPRAYTCGVYGWNSDIYQMPGGYNVLISTGYRPTHYAHNDRAARVAELIKAALLKYEKQLDKRRPAGNHFQQQRRVEARLAKIAARAYAATADTKDE